MPVSVVMPALEMAQDTGKLVAWRKQEGERVTKGEVLVEVETDKAVVEVEALADGILAGVKASPGDVIPVGQTIAWILGNGESVPADEVLIPSPVGGSRSSASPAAAAGKPRPENRSVTDRVKISPKARRLAQERGVDISRLSGSGSEGEVLVSDVLAAASAGTPANAASAAADAKSAISGDSKATEALSAVARLMAERTTQSWTTVPHFFVTREVEASGLNGAKEKLSRSTGDSPGARLTHTDLLISIVARALEKHPRLNASWTGKAIQYQDKINVGIAMAVEDGVVTGVIRDANKADLAEIARQRRDLGDRARSGHLRPNDISGATFTISNLGMYHVNNFTAIIVPPQAAILAVGEIADRVVAVEGIPTVRPMISLTLSCDHRVVDGARAAEFMQTVATIMQASN
jgi:pyruvate dehydrogenase E2 component (dihydrolipoyllysine-residue acetyltransferase)